MSGGRSCLADSVESAPGSGIQPRVIRATVQGGRSGGPFNPGPSSAEGVPGDARSAASRYAHRACAALARNFCNIYYMYCNICTAFAFILRVVW